MNMTVEDQIYACKYVNKLGVDKLCKDLGKYPKNLIVETLNKLKANGVYKQYKELSEVDYENMINLESKAKRGRPKKQLLDHSKNLLLVSPEEHHLKQYEESCKPDWQKEYEVLDYKVKLLQEENEKYKKALLNLCLKV